MRPQTMLYVWLLFCLSLPSPLKIQLEDEWISVIMFLLPSSTKVKTNDSSIRWHGDPIYFSSILKKVSDKGSYHIILVFETQVLTVEGKIQLLKAFLWFPHVCILTHVKAHK